MRNFRHSKLPFYLKITLYVMVVFGLLLALGTALSLGQQQRSLRRDFEGRAEILLATLAEFIQREEAVPAAADLRHLTRRLGWDSAIQGLWLYGAGGDLLVFVRRPGLPPAPGAGAGLLPAPGSAAVKLAWGPEELQASRRLNSDLNSVRGIRLELATEPLEEILREARLQGWATAAMLLVAGILFFAAISRNLLKPLRRLVAVASSQAGKLAETKGEDELTQLTDSFQAVADHMAQTLSREAETVEDLERRREEALGSLEEARTELERYRRGEQALKRDSSILTARLQQRSEELGKAHSELVSTAQVRDQFLASMSHELRTPLNAVLGLSEILQDETYGEVNPRQRSFLQSIAESGQHLLAVINDLLDFARLESGGYELEPAPIPMLSVCRASLERQAAKARAKGVEIFSALPNEEVSIYADRRCLKKILDNLLSNAVKFTASGGEAHLEVEVDEGAEVARFTVWDTGLGIAPEDLEQLFEPFVQLDSRLARRFGGTGLGLSLVYQLAELHGGSVSVESELGQGSRFTVSLPLKPVQGRSEAEVSSECRCGTSPRSAKDRPLVLVAEDNPANVQAIRAFLEGNRYSVLVAENGREAIRLARSRSPELVVMDIQMPEMDGLEATRRFRADPELAALPIVAVTALAMPGDEERCLAAGVDAYMSKPVRLADLLSVVDHWLRVGAKRGREAKVLRERFDSVNSNERPDRPSGSDSL